jgi:type IV pilus assembly protein PilX
MSGRMKPGLEAGHRQLGAVLIFCLVFLFVLTMMSVASMESSILEEKMAGNMFDYDKAFHAAEAALQTGEARLSAQGFQSDASSEGSTGIWGNNAMDPEVFNSIPWWNEPARNKADWWNETAVLLADFPGLAVSPAYIIEEYASAVLAALETGAEDTEYVFYRVTARGTGGQDSTVVQLQSFFARSNSSVSAALNGRKSWRQLD